MHIDVLVDVYPHSSKPYLDAQFLEWQRAGHSVSVYSIGTASGVAPIPVTILRSVRQAPWLLIRAALNLLLYPSRSWRVIRAGRSREIIKNLCLDAQLPRHRADLFFIHNLAAAARCSYLKGVISTPIAMYYHGGEIAGVAPISPGDAKRAFDAVDVVYSNTAYSVSEAIARGADPAKTRKLPVGFDLSRFPDRQRSYKDSGTLRVVSIGRLSPEKGFDMALRAIQELGRADVEYTIVGSGPQKAQLEELARQLRLSVTFTGHLSPDGVSRQLAMSDVLLLSSYRETQACVMQEAMLMRVPVVASRAGGIPESIPAEMHPFLFEPGNQSDLAASLRRVLDADLQTLGAIGRFFVEKNYDIREINKLLLAHASRSPRSY